MSSTVALIQFAAEFVTFLVAAAGLALVVLRDEFTTSRPAERLALSIGFFVTALAAFGHGSLLLNNEVAAVVVLRVAGIAGLAVGSIWWWRGRGVARQLLWVGLGAYTVAVVFEVTGAGRAADGALAVGSILIGAALLAASRRSVAARVASSAAGTLLLVVLVLSVALSAVLSSSIQHEELNRLQSRALTEASLAGKSYTSQVATASYTGLFLYENLYNANKLSATEIQGLLSLVRNIYPVSGLEFLLPGRTIIDRAGLDQLTATLLAGQPIVSSLTCKSSVGAIYVVAKQLQSVGAYALCAPNSGNLSPTVIGIVLAARPLDDSYLSDRHTDDPNLSLAIVNQSAVLAKVGALPSDRNMIDLASTVVATDVSIEGIVGNRYVAAYPIAQVGTSPPAAVIVSTPTSSVTHTRDQLFQTLFLIALGGTLIALGLAVVIGDRITARLRRLTLVAEAIQRGERGERAGIVSDDEMGVLGATFDSMADSIEEQTRALREAADDETRLRSRLEAVVAGMGDALVAVDARGNVTDFNQAAEEMTGLTAASAIGQPVDQVVRLVNEDGASLGPRLVAPSPTRWGMLATAIGYDDSEFPVAVSAGALRGAGNELVGQVLVMRDLRREREVERMKTEFLSRVGHELRTPLTGIMGYAEFLLRRTVPAERAQLAYEEILVSAKRLLRVVEMLEFFASTGAGRVLLRPEPLDVHLLIDTVVAPWEERLTPPNSITTRVDRVPDILGDKRWLALAIDELIDNAVKFSPRGAEVTVTVMVGAVRPGYAGMRGNVLALPPRRDWAQPSGDDGEGAAGAGVKSLTAGSDGVAGGPAPANGGSADRTSVLDATGDVGRPNGATGERSLADGAAGRPAAEGAGGDGPDANGAGRPAAEGAGGDGPDANGAGRPAAEGAGGDGPDANGAGGDAAVVSGAAGGPAAVTGAAAADTTAADGGVGAGGATTPGTAEESEGHAANAAATPPVAAQAGAAGADTVDPASASGAEPASVEFAEPSTVEPPSAGAVELFMAGSDGGATDGDGSDGDLDEPQISERWGDAISVLEIAVSDRGKGMTPEEQATAFGEFVQGDSSDTRQFGGLGLGLSLVQRVVEGHGGAVKCASIPGRGSTFTILLPLPPGAETDFRTDPIAREFVRRHGRSRIR